MNIMETVTERITTAKELSRRRLGVIREELMSAEEVYDSAIMDVIGPHTIVDTNMAKIYLGMAKTTLGKKEVIKFFNSKDHGPFDMRALENRKKSVVGALMCGKAYYPDINTRPVTLIDINGKQRIVDGIVDKYFCTGTRVRLVDYGIRMDHFGSPDTLDKSYESGIVIEDNAIAIGTIYAEAHQRAETNDDIVSAGQELIRTTLERYASLTKDEVSILEKMVTKEKYGMIISSISQFIETNKDYLKQRGEKGFIRCCHGDGRAENWLVYENEHKIMDGIGRCMDVVADIVTAYVSALTYGRKDIAEKMKETYMTKTQDIDGAKEGIEKLFDFYVTYQAFVSGKYTLAKAVNSEESERQMLFDKAKMYFDMAVNYAPNMFKFDGDIRI